MVADERGTYEVRPRARKAQAKFEGSSRYYRGRIFDVLRALPRGGSLAVARLPGLIANGQAALSLEEVRRLVEALEGHGLVEVDRERVRLPE